MSNTATKIDKDTQDYLESLVDKIERITRIKDWEHIIIKYDLDNTPRAKNAYDDMLDDCYPKVMDIYEPSDVLKHVDPIAYDVGYQDFLSDQVSNGIGIEKDSFMFYQHELENLLTKLTKESNNEQKNTK